MSLILLNLQSKQQFELENDSPLIIGRGNVVGCFDKRVSRSHGRVTCTVDGKLRLAALHCNPCFFTRNGVPPVQQLNKNEEETLNEGDYLGLLPNAFWFKVTSSKEKEIKRDPDSLNTIDENNKAVVHSENLTRPPADERLISDNAGCTFDKKLEKNSLSSVPILSTELNPAGPSNKFGTPEFEKTKRLPLWMYEIDEPNDSIKSPSKRSLSRDTQLKGKKQKLLSEPEIKKETEPGDDTINLELPSTSKVNVKIENIDNSSNQPTESQLESQNTTQLQAEASKEGAKEGYESNVVEENNVVRRKICQYEGNCYRKNPKHRLEFCHPGESDYIPYEERPLCQYGATCYRKNEQHRAEFRHPPPGSNCCDIPSPSCSRGSIGEERPPCLSGSSCYNQNPQHRKTFYHPPKGYICHFSRPTTNVSTESSVDWDSDSSYDCYFEDYNNWDGYWKTSSPLPDKRRRKKVKKQNSDYENDDDYDLEDPFINDASSDEYIPSEMDSEEEEEIFDSSREDD